MKRVHMAPCVAKEVYGPLKGPVETFLLVFSDRAPRLEFPLGALDKTGPLSGKVVKMSVVIGFVPKVMLENIYII